jgi:hypothetical protein
MALSRWHHLSRQKPKVVLGRRHVRRSCRGRAGIYLADAAQSGHVLRKQLDTESMHVADLSPFFAVGSRGLCSLGFWDDYGRQRGCSLDPSIALHVSALILASLFRNFVQDDPRACPKVEAFNNAKHRNANAHLASVDGKFAYTCCFAAEPNREFRVGGVVALMKENACLALHVWRRDDRPESVFFEVIETLIGAVKALYERPFHGRDGDFRYRSPLAQVLPIVRQVPARIDDVDLLDAQGVHVPDDRPNILHVGRILEHSDQVLAAKLLDCIRALANRPFWLRCFFHRHAPGFSLETSANFPK